MSYGGAAYPPPCEQGQVELHSVDEGAAARDPEDIIGIRTMKELLVELTWAKW